MNKVRPYLFWIIAGVLILVELILMVSVTPSFNGKSPEDVKHEVDAQQKLIDKLYAQAKAGPPTQVFDPLDQKDMTMLMSNWLVTKYWQQPLEDELNAFSAQMRQIRDHLVERSKSLHEPMSKKLDAVYWYEDYKNQTAELLKSLKDADCLILPQRRPSASSPMGMGMPPGMVPPPNVASPAGAPEDDGGPDYKTDAAVRSVAGFFTMTKEFPEAERYDAFTTEYRIMSMIARVLETCKGTNEPSPIAPQKKPYEETAKLVKTTFETESDDMVAVDLQLQGTVSALLAAEAGLEENKDETEAVRVVTGGSLRQKPYTKDEHLHVSSENALLELHIAFLDFTNLKNDIVDVVPVHEAAAPAPRNHR